MQLFPLLKRAGRYALPLVAGAMLAGTAVAKDIRIAHVYSKTGFLAAYGAQTQTECTATGNASWCRGWGRARRWRRRS